MPALTRWLARLFLGVVCAAPAAAQNAFTFAAFGDTPYTEEEEARHIGMLAEINREAPAFVIHVGDFKSGWSPCTDALFIQRRDAFALLHPPLIYTPGDNEWTDCHRALGAASDPLERLQKLRSLFFADGNSLGQRKIALARQSEAYPENARWSHAGILFATLNVPGSNNNARMPAEMAARDKANEAWVAATFASARAQGQDAVVLAMQANPWANSGAVKTPYAGLMAAITRETLNFRGEVLLIHGDTHRFRVDQPLRDTRSQQALRNFTRIEVFGSPFMNWVRVRVNRHNGKVSFSVTPGS